MKILVTGSRNYRDADVIERALEEVAAPEQLHELVHGDQEGADRLAARIARAWGWRIRAYPAEWRRHGRRAGPIRNQQMIDREAPDLVLAFPLPGSRGTWDCVRRARRAGIEVRIKNGADSRRPRWKFARQTE